jgi:hypothetical protein
MNQTFSGSDEQEQLARLRQIFENERRGALAPQRGIAWGAVVTIAGVVAVLAATALLQHIHF